MLKFAKRSRKFILSIISTFAMFVGVASASSATIALVHQPKCPEHLLK